MIQKSKDFFNENRQSFAFTSPISTEDLYIDYSNWIVASWYPPVNKEQKKSKVPEDDIFSTIRETTTTETTTTANILSFEYDSNLVDEYGWVQITGGFYNVEANILLENHPFN